jgi:hypothetical protein
MGVWCCAGDVRSTCSASSVSTPRIGCAVQFRRRASRPRVGPVQHEPTSSFLQYERRSGHAQARKGAWLERFGTATIAAEDSKRQRPRPAVDPRSSATTDSSGRSQARQQNVQNMSKRGKNPVRSWDRLDALTGCEAAGRAKSRHLSPPRPNRLPCPAEAEVASSNLAGRMLFRRAQTPEGSLRSRGSFEEAPGSRRTRTAWRPRRTS